MRITSPFAVTLSVAEYRTLIELTRQATAPARAVLRAKIVLAAARRESNASIAGSLGVHVDTVRKWRRRFTADRLAGLRDRPRPGRPRTFSAVQVAQVKALACEPPGRHELPLTRWSATELATVAVRQQVVSSVSASTIRRWLAQDAIKPWRYRSWIFPRDPDFKVKATRVLGLYARRWAGRRLRPDEYVLSADEKTGVQALRRIHPGLPTGPLPTEITARGGSGSSGWTCTPGAATSCTLEDLAGGDQTTLHVRVEVGADAVPGGKISGSIRAGNGSNAPIPAGTLLVLP